MNIIKFLRNYLLLLKSDFFDSKYYLQENPDVAKAKVNPILHYLQFGWKEGRNPSPLFNTNDYISFRPDIVQTDICPLVHYELFGKREFLSFYFDKIKHLEKKISDLDTKLEKNNINLDNSIFKFEKFKYDVLFTYRRGINKEKVSYDIENFFDSSDSGITNEQRKNEIIVSLTSYPARMHDIHYAIYSLLTQKLKPNKIILWLGKEYFPNRDKDLYKNLLKFTKYGLTIKYTKDLRSYTKLIPTLKEYPNALIVTADDDIFYPQDWLKKLYNEYEQNKNCIICHRAHRIKIENKKILPYKTWDKEIIVNNPSFHNFLTGVGGVLYAPNMFYKEFLNDKLFMELTPQNDDIWFWAMAVLNDTKIKIVDDPINILTYINPEKEIGFNNDITLTSSNVQQSQNDIQLNKVLTYYPQIMEKLLTE